MRCRSFPAPGSPSRPRRGRAQAKRKNTISVIGTFTAKGNKFTGSVATLTIRATIRIAPVQRLTDAHPSHRVFAGEAEVGAAWSKRSRKGKHYLSVRLDDPSLIAPVYASLVADDRGKGHSLQWSRGKRREGATR